MNSLSGKTIMQDLNLEDTINYLFDRYWDEDLSEEDEDALEERASTLVQTYGWSFVYQALTEYLYNNCHTPEDAINAACNFWNYRWADYVIPNPYVFLSFLYYKIDLDEVKYDQPGILDSLSITILPKAGIKQANLMENPNYSPLLDSALLSMVDEWKSGKNLFALN